MDNVGIPIDQFVDSVVAAYVRGFEDAIKHLSSAKESLNIKNLKDELVKTIASHESSKTW